MGYANTPWPNIGFKISNKKCEQWHHPSRYVGTRNINSLIRTYAYVTPPSDGLITVVLSRLFTTSFADAKRGHGRSWRLLSGGTCTDSRLLHDRLCSRRTASPLAICTAAADRSSRRYQNKKHRSPLSRASGQCPGVGDGRWTGRNE